MGNINKVVGIDLFCGIGGLTHGLVKSGIKIKAGFDIDPTCEFSYSQKLNGNPKFVCKDLAQITSDDLELFFQEDDYKLICGSPPCQPYSSHQKKKDFNSRAEHKSYGLIREFLRIVDLVKPEFVIMENVRGLINDPYFQNEFLNYFEENGYFSDYSVIDCSDWGAPQRRKRLIFLATKNNVKDNYRFQIPKPNLFKELFAPLNSNSEGFLIYEKQKKIKERKNA